MFYSIITPLVRSCEMLYLPEQKIEFCVRTVVLKEMKVKVLRLSQSLGYEEVNKHLDDLEVEVVIVTGRYSQHEF